MDKLETYRQVIRTVLQPYVNISYANVDVRNLAAFDAENDQYLIMSEGWGKKQKQRLHGCLIHLEILNDKVWIQRDGTEDGIAGELEEAGIPKEDMVLGFHDPAVRQYTGYAIA